MEFIGLIPAAGTGRRLAPFRYPKELLPIAYEKIPGSSVGIRPRVVGELSIEALVRAGIRRCLIIVAPWKLEVMTYFGDGAEMGVDIAYVYQETARGLPHAVDLAYGWTTGCHTAFIMPDTYILPSDCLSRLRTFYQSSKADLVLGLFPTNEPERLGPVILEGDRVTAVYDKCAEPPARNTWGVAIWGPAFSELIHSSLPRSVDPMRELVLGNYFQLAVQNGLAVKGMLFEDGAYVDLGTPQGIRLFSELLKRDEPS